VEDNDLQLVVEAVGYQVADDSDWSVNGNDPPAVAAVAALTAGGPIRAKMRSAPTSAAVVPAPQVQVTEVKYEEWIPAAARYEMPGSFVDVTAKLQTKDGSAPKDKAKITFELTDVSQEPGVCINWPPNPAADDNDLKFDTKDDTNLTYSGDLKAETKQDCTEVKCRINCYDFGAYGTLRVTGEVRGKSVDVVYKDAPGRDSLLLPKRTLPSRIADAWKAQVGMMGAPDDDDSETIPPGDVKELPAGVKELVQGDGLTLYEEYRGALVSDKERRSRPERLLRKKGHKKLFVCNELKAKPDLPVSANVIKAVSDGIELFGTLTGIDIFLVIPSALKNRVINFNSTAEHRKCEQHAVRIIGSHMRKLEDGKPDESAAMATGGPPEGPPGSHDATYVFADHPELADPTKFDAQRVMRGIVHELGHQVNIPHHAPQDLVVAERQSLLTHGFWIAQPGGAHSGDLVCPMRYREAKYFQTSDKYYYYRWTLEGNRVTVKELDKDFLDWSKWGAKTSEVFDIGNFCTDKGETAQNRVGPATLGACAYRILVRDY
jgi:hypothetical protein